MAVTESSTIRIDGKVKSELRETAGKFGMSECELVSRICRLFTDFPQSVQIAALDILPDDYQVEIAELILKLRKQNGIVPTREIPEFGKKKKK